MVNHLKQSTLACFIAILTFSCSQAQQSTSADPVAFGAQFNSVCKVGIKGGDGTLIEKKWVLTAGHVATGMYKRTDGNLSVYFDNGQAVKVKTVYIHPRFKPMGLYDLALLELAEPVAGISPVKINALGNELNQQIIIAGHGDKKLPDGTWIKDGRLRAYTNIIDQVNDTHIIFDYDGPNDDPTEREGTSGPGDSGGPAFILRDNELYVAGVSSMGEPGINGAASFGAVEHFVRVSKFHDWIKETMSHPKRANAFTGKAVSPPASQSSAVLSNSAQAKRARAIIDALEDYSAQKMEAAITETYDESILGKRDAGQIIQNMPFLIKQLQNSKLDKVRSETPSKISVQMKKDGVLFVLDFLFGSESQKIEQMGFGRID
jgi:hypothetical protein